VTNVRFIIAASHIAASCGDLINEHPDIFCDFYRYETPSLEEKLALVNKYSVY